MKNGIRWLKLVLFIMPVVALLMGVNYFVDAGNVFHNVEESMAGIILDGNSTYVKSSNVSDRMLKYYLMAGLDESVETVAVGSSIVMCVSANDVGTDSFYNLGVSSANYYDVMATFGIMDVYGIHPDKIIYCVDWLFFDEEHDERWETLSEYAYYMENVLKGQKSEAPKQAIGSSVSDFSQLFSITYFQSSLSYFIKSGLDSVNGERYGIWENTDGSALVYQYYMNDASLVYAADFQENTAEDVAVAAQEYDLSSVLTENYSLTEDRIEMFELLMDYLENNGTEVLLMIVPFSPSLWERTDLETYPLLVELEDYLNTYAEENGMRLLGSFNPYNVGISDDDYYDSRHIRRERLGVYFDLD